ncbi:fimbrial isopeptide formation D2 domain-containing protein [Pseudoscardovia radai]|uniref:Fimbrial isopeptide formation D2 domain-containing protein n=1 Tax=Pseudoscardovia radai TaxID=987066 RepID=A0A261EZR2_9BIFI|nr:isopeptide-forming domain-containing fimbrial protein [Pseudoscardovia radai]OZG52166.1 fimbrial isopeptide formation D2 domain-containing protein [Pseudoscardovia radai]
MTRTRKLIAALVAMMTVVGMAFMTMLPARPALADPTDTSGITVVNAQPGHTYSAYRFATFSNVKAASTDTIASMDVTTVPGPSEDNNQRWVYKLHTACMYGNDSVKAKWSDAYGENPAAFMATLTGDELASVAAMLSLPEGLAPNGSATVPGDAAQDLTIPKLPEGWYVIKDSGTDKLAIVATPITSNGTIYTKFLIDEGTGQSAIADTLGRFYAKAEEAQSKPHKEVYSDAAHTNADDLANFSIGDTLYYTIDTRISPHAANYNDYTFVIMDQASRGLTLNPTAMKVMFADAAITSDTEASAATLTNGADYSWNVSTAADKTTTMTITITSPKALAGKYLRVAYPATINADIVKAGTYTSTSTDAATSKTSDTTEDLAANKAYNSARVNANGQGWTDKWDTTVFTGSISFTKVGVGADTALADVTFNLFRGDSAKQSDTNKPLTFDKVMDGDKVVDGEYNYNPSGKVTNLVTDANGKITVNGLAANEVPNPKVQAAPYTFKETSTNTAKGYAQSILATFTVDHAIGDNGDVTNTLSSTKNNTLGLATISPDGAITVKNVKNVTQLPLTGAAGVVLFTFLALVIAGIAVTLTVTYRRARKGLEE